MPAPETRTRSGNSHRIVARAAPSDSGSWPIMYAPAWRRPRLVKGMTVTSALEKTP